MKFLLFYFVFSISASGYSQKIIGSVMTDENAITNDVKKAKFLIVEKQINDSDFEKLEYYFTGCLITRASFRDKELKLLNGEYADYHPNGYLATSGQYINNKKDGIWYLYDDTSKAITKYVFHLDSLLATIDLDSLDKENNKIKKDTTDQIEAVYKGGNAKLPHIITSNFRVPDRTLSINKGGTVNVRFIIDPNGKPTNITVLHSVEFAFDEEAMRVISLMDKWIPASDKGRKVNAYRIQPITISLGN